MNTKVTLSVLKRNFFAYFTSPTGYVFICVFVLLCSFAAFWPNEFFNMNLANLGQLNKVFAMIMLLFIPAITMSTWAEERRLGTDELLLTLPARDIDIVMGKYFAAVGIYTVSLLFASVCLFSVLRFLGQPDLGLFVSTFIGYWLIGLAMLAIGMAASFLTDNLTMAYIFGVLFNAPLVFASMATNLSWTKFGREISQWSFSNQFEPFGRGLVTMSGIFYFAAVSAVMLYICMFLISRRHWLGGKQAQVKILHFAVRTISLIVIVFGLTTIVRTFHCQADFTTGRLNSMASETKVLIDKVQSDRPVRIEAFLSETVPQQYVQTKLQIERMLNEISSRGGKRFDVDIHYLSPFSQEALLADKQYGIKARKTAELSRDLRSVEDVYMSVVFSSGLEQVILPFIDPGMSVDYELSQALATVTKKERKRIGVVRTDVQMFSGIDFTAMQNTPEWKIIEELKRAYNVDEVNPAEPIDADAYDALVAIQPSSLGPDELTNFIAAIKAGTPTAIFEDPVPAFDGSIPGSGQPRRPPGNPMMSMMMQQQAPPKGNIEELWNLLNIRFDPQICVWQSYNPIPIFTEFPAEFIFIEPGAGEPNAFAKIAATKDMQRILMPVCGSIEMLNASQSKAGTAGVELRQTYLLRTGPNTGTVPYSRLFNIGPMGARAGVNFDAAPDMVNKPLDVAVWIQSKDWKRAEKKADAAKPAEDKVAEDKAADDKTADDKTAEEAKTAEEPVKINVIVTADVDMLHDAFFQLRNQVLEEDVRFDNVSYVLNVIDTIAGEETFLQLRSRRPQHRTLTRINEATKTVKNDTDKATAELKKDYEAKIKAEEDRIQEEADKLSAKIREQNLDTLEVAQRVNLLQRDMEKRVEAQKEVYSRENEQKIKVLQTDYRTKVARIQDRCKFMAVVIPPILPLFLAIAVFIYRRVQEYEGVNKTRLRSKN